MWRSYQSYYTLPLIRTQSFQGSEVMYKVIHGYGTKNSVLSHNAVLLIKISSSQMSSFTPQCYPRFISPFRLNDPSITSGLLNLSVRCHRTEMRLRQDNFRLINGVDCWVSLVYKSRIMNDRCQNDAVL
jgi:hypothetical protein